MTNPGRGCGMKQACKVGGGKSRRGAEKARGRNEAGPGKPRKPFDGIVDAAGDVAMRDEILGRSGRLS